jgi:hypothetical protein
MTISIILMMSHERTFVELANGSAGATGTRRQQLYGGHMLRVGSTNSGARESGPWLPPPLMFARLVPVRSQSTFYHMTLRHGVG